MAEAEKIEYTKYEKARMVGARALQISMGAPFVLKIGKKELEEAKYNPVKLAMQEYDAGVLPLTIKRPFPDTRKKAEKEEKEDKGEKEEKD